MPHCNRRGLLAAMPAAMLVLATSPALAQATASPPPVAPAANAGPDRNTGPGMMGHASGAGRGPGMMGGRGAGMMADPSGYLDDLKTELGIAQGQLPAWTRYADAVKGSAAEMQGSHQAMWASMQTADWQERQSMMNDMFQARQQASGLVHDAALALLPTLTEAQRQKAQTSLPGLGPGMGGGPGMSHGMMRRPNGPPPR